MDYKGGNGYIISPCSSVNSRSVLASNVIGNQCKSKKPLSAAKACIPQILPSKFKPKLLPPSGDSEESRTGPAGHPKAHSCEDLYTGICDTECTGAEERESGQHSDSSSDCADGLRNVTPAIRRTASEFSSLYRTMHHIQRPSSVGSSPHGSVHSLASLFEKAKVKGCERSEASEAGNIPRDAVSSRVSEFEMIIQRSSSAPTRSSSLPTLHSTHSPGHSPSAHLCMTSAVSAESLLVVEPTQMDGCSLVDAQDKTCGEEVLRSDNETTEEFALSEYVRRERTESPSATEAEVEQILSQSCPEDQGSPAVSASKSPSALFTASPLQHNHHHHHHHLLHHLNHHLLLKPSKCKGSCPASYTRFTTILRHERQRATAQQERPPPQEKKTALPGNLFLMGPAPFRLRKTLQSHQARRTLSATKVTMGTQRAYSASPELRPLIPQRLSSLEVLERLSNGEGGNTDHLSNGQSLDANGNLLHPLAAHCRGGYLHTFTRHPPLSSSLTRAHLFGHPFFSTLSSPCVPFFTKRRCLSPSLACVLCYKVTGKPPSHFKCGVWCSSISW